MIALNIRGEGGLTVWWLEREETGEKHILCPRVCNFKGLFEERTGPSYHTDVWFCQLTVKWSQIMSDQWRQATNGAVYNVETHLYWYNAHTDCPVSRSLPVGKIVSQYMDGVALVGSSRPVPSPHSDIIGLSLALLLVSKATKNCNLPCVFFSLIEMPNEVPGAPSHYLGVN